MAELRVNYLTGEPVYIAAERGYRPMEYGNIEAQDDKSENNCPFCPENKHLAAKEVFCGSDNKTRIIMNKYPFVEEDSKTAPGGHYVLIDTVLHNTSFLSLNIDEMASVFQTAQDFCRKLDAVYVQIFKNSGALAGASLRHSHWQIAALPYIPSKQRTIYSNSKDFFGANGKCYLCSSFESERFNEYIVYENTYFVAYCPFASKFTYEINIMPKEHTDNFNLLDSSHLIAMADCFKRCLTALNELLSDFTYNVFFQNGASSGNNNGYIRESVHFNITIAPRTGYFGGLELSTGEFINSVAPETAAEKLRGLILR